MYLALIFSKDPCQNFNFDRYRTENMTLYWECVPCIFIRHFPTFVFL